MTVFTRRAAEIFAPAASGGRARGPILTHARLWGTEVERSVFEIGTWTATITFETPGDQTIVQSNNDGEFVKFGRLYWLSFTIATSTFTHTTASGRLLITGLPVAAGQHEVRSQLARFAGLTKAGFAQFTVGAPAGESYLTLAASGSGQTLDEEITTADLPTGGTVQLGGIIPLLAANA